jgi:hypothetical protein
MKKLVVVDEETTSSLKNIVAEFLSMQYNYGLYDFNTDKLFADLNVQYGIELKATHIPYYELEDKNGGFLKLMFMEQYD